MLILLACKVCEESTYLKENNGVNVIYMNKFCAVIIILHIVGLVTSIENQSSLC